MTLLPWPARPLAVLALTGLAASAQAAVLLPGGDTLLNGNISDIQYATQGAVEIAPALYISQLGGTLPPKEQVTGVQELSYSYSISGLGSSLMTVEYVIRNAASSLKTWTDLRFFVYVQPDGEPVAFQDSVSETWGPKQAGDPDKRISQAFNAGGELLNNLSSANGIGGAEGTGVPAACSSPSTCDAEMALQWNLSALNPGESFIVRVGLSDNGQHLSSRYFTTLGAGQDETLTISGVATVVAVPEAQTAAMLLAGLGVVGALSGTARRRQG